jgi:hypothetical protein
MLPRRGRNTSLVFSVNGSVRSEKRLSLISLAFADPAGATFRDAAEYI